MNKTVYMILLCATLVAPITTHCDIKSFFKNKKSLFNRYKFEKIDQKELPAVSIDSISITNINGPITIKTGWKKNSLFLKTTKRSKKEEDLNNIEVVDSIQDKHLTITSKYKNKKLVGSVEYELIVPASLNVALTISETGDVSVKNINGTINVVTNDNITITKTQKLASLRTLKKGSITVSQASGPVEAYSHYGNINGENIANSFNAHSTSGKVNITYKTLPSTSSINVQTTSGNIMLALPSSTNAEIHGHTAHGTFTSDHYITLKPYTTQLNSSAWNKFKKEVEGTLGTGQATIALQSINGNVKITEAKTT